MFGLLLQEIYNERIIIIEAMCSKAVYWWISIFAIVNSFENWLESEKSPIISLDKVIIIMIIKI